MSTALRCLSSARLRQLPTTSRLSLLTQSQIQRQSPRTYYSEHHPDAHPFPTVQESILSSALRHVPQLGFTDEALTAGAKDAGYLEVSVQLFPRGVYDLINYYLVTQRLALKDRVQFDQDVKLGLGRKVKALSWERLLMNKDIIHQWQGVSFWFLIRAIPVLFMCLRMYTNGRQALGHMSLLGNIPASLAELNNLSDEIWYLAGDTAVDFSWYTKRASLAAVYASSELFMTTDKSNDFAATEEFLDRRLKDVQKVGGAVGGFSSYVGFWAGNSVNLARSWGMKV